MVPDEISSLSGHGDQAIRSSCQISLFNKVTVHTVLFCFFFFLESAVDFSSTY